MEGKFRKMIGAWLFAVLLVSSIAAAPATADVPPLEVKEYRKDFEVPVAQAEEALEVQNSASEADIVGDLEGRLGAGYAGLWFDNESGEFVVPLLPGVSGAAVTPEFTQADLSADVFRVSRAQSSWEELEAAQNAINEALLQSIDEGLIQTSLDPRTNAVVITQVGDAGSGTQREVQRLTASSSVQVEVRTSKANSFEGELESCTDPFCDAPLRGGVKIYSPPYLNQSECTAAFPAVGANGSRYLLTAGHCVEEVYPGAPLYQGWTSQDSGLQPHLIGNAEQWVRGAAGDWAKIKVEGSPWNTGPWLGQIAYWGAPIFDSNGAFLGKKPPVDLEYPITGQAANVVGNYACRSGMVSGSSCGTITALNVTHSWAGYAWKGLVELKGACSIPGDSGAPYFSGNSALGIHVGSGEGSSVCGLSLYYSDINKATASLGVSIISPPSVRAAFVDAGNANTITAWEYSAQTGWQQIFLWGHPVAAGTKPFLMKYEGSTHIFYVDAGRENKITEWSWNPATGWQQAFLETDPVAAGSSITGYFQSGYANLFFADAAHNRSITAEVRISGAWYPAPFYGDSVAPNSSPSAVLNNGQGQIYFNDGSKGNTMAVWTWNSVSGWQQSFFYQHTIAANTSPSAVSNNNQAQVFFNDATNANTVSAWTWGATLQQVPFYGDTVAAGSSPSAIVNNGETQVYFSDASKGHTVSVWNWGSTIHQTSLGQDPIAPNTSPSAVSTSGTPQVFFADEATNNSMSLWEWTPTLLQQIRLFGHPLVAGSSPGS